MTKNIFSELMGAGQVGRGAGEFGYFVEDQRGVAGLNAAETGRGEDKGQGSVNIGQHGPEIPADPEGLPDRVADHDGTADRLRRGARLAGVRQDAAQPGVILIQVGIDQRLFHRTLFGFTVQHRPRQPGHVRWGQVPFPAQLTLAFRTGLIFRNQYGEGSREMLLHYPCINLHRTFALIEHFSGPPAQFLAQTLVLEQRDEPVPQIADIPELHHRLLLQELLHDVTEMPRVRPGDDRLGKIGRLHDVVAAQGRGKATRHHGHRSDGVYRPQFPEGIQDDDRRNGLAGLDRSRRSPGRRQA